MHLENGQCKVFGWLLGSTANRNLQLPLCDRVTPADARWVAAAAALPGLGVPTITLHSRKTINNCPAFAPGTHPLTHTHVRVHPHTASTLRGQPAPPAQPPVPPYQPVRVGRHRVPTAVSHLYLPGLGPGLIGITGLPELPPRQGPQAQLRWGSCAAYLFYCMAPSTSARRGTRAPPRTLTTGAGEGWDGGHGPEVASQGGGRGCGTGGSGDAGQWPRCRTWRCKCVLWGHSLQACGQRVHVYCFV